MRNWDTEVARRYHEETKHSFRSVRASRHSLDWGNRPHPFKAYVGLDSLPLPHELERLLRWGAGVIRTRGLPGGDVYHFRTYSSAGALYPVEVYVASGELDALPAGLYHLHPGELALRRLRDVDVRAVLADAAGLPDLRGALAVLVLTGILWRTAWKYQARGYRHLYWDAGTMLANLLALADDGGLAPSVATGFLDGEVNRVVGVDGAREGALALLSVGGGGEPTARTGELERLSVDVAPLSAAEVQYREAYELHRASAIEGGDDLERYRDSLPGTREGEPGRGGRASSLAEGGEPLEAVLRRRGSARDFALAAFPVDHLEELLAFAADSIPADVPHLTEIRLIANAIDGLEPGAYRYTLDGGFELLRRGQFRRQAGYLCLEQVHAARAGATLFFMADLDDVLARLGNRGYRAAQLDGGIRLGRAYLGAAARRLGCTGLTFYDDDVAEFLAPGTSLQAMTCAAVGVRERR